MGDLLPFKKKVLVKVEAPPKDSPEPPKKRVKVGS